MRNRSVPLFACDFALAALLVSSILCVAATADDQVPPGRVLFIGIDGCRFDALEKARTPNLDRLRAAGCYSDRTQILGTRYRKSDTVSGPGPLSLSLTVPVLATAGVVTAVPTTNCVLPTPPV